MTPVASTVTASPAELEDLILRFVDAARQRGEYHIHSRRRADRRYHRSWPLAVAIRRRDGLYETTAALHNVSVQGVAFLAPFPLDPGARLFIRPFWHDENCPRVPAVVRHATPTATGYLIGCEFVLEPPAPDPGNAGQPNDGR
jgi:hypothetical protein